MEGKSDKVGVKRKLDSLEGQQVAKLRNVDRAEGPLGGCPGEGWTVERGSRVRGEFQDCVDYPLSKLEYWDAIRVMLLKAHSNHLCRTEYCKTIRIVMA